MRRHMTGLALAGGVMISSFVTFLPNAARADGPPVVVKTVPALGETNVDPGLKEVRVTFSKDMMTNEQWSWCMDSKDTFPTIDKDKIRYLADKRTCVLPVRLEAGKTYVIWANSQKFNYFKDVQGNSAIPYRLTFTTAGDAVGTGSKAEKTAAMSAAKAWLRLVDNGQYDQAWDNAAQYLKSACPKAQFAHAVKAARAPLGKHGKRKIASRDFHTSLPGMPDGKYLVIELKGSFANKASSVETITPMLDKDGQWRVAGYYIR